MTNFVYENDEKENIEYTSVDNKIFFQYKRMFSRYKNTSVGQRRGVLAKRILLYHAENDRRKESLKI